MSSPTDRYFIAVAPSQGATLAVYETNLDTAQVQQLRHVLTGLARLGHVAVFSIDRAAARVDGAGVIDALRRRWDIIVDAVLAADAPPAELAPAFLMPVWSFNHELNGRPASTARFLHLDLEVIALAQR